MVDRYGRDKAGIGARVMRTSRWRAKFVGENQSNPLACDVGGPKAALRFPTRLSIQEKAMHKLILGAALTAVIAIPGALYSSSADAGARKHRWGDRDWEIIRWSNGDCKIWFDDASPPWGVQGRDWTVAAAGLRSYDEAWRALVRLRGLRRCL
jgi:hypothetical protein